jgi:hypothetical protein
VRSGIALVVTSFNHERGSVREEASRVWSDPENQPDPLHPLPPFVIDARPEKARINDKREKRFNGCGGNGRIAEAK